jgi:AraC-like DNA-binding protein
MSLTDIAESVGFTPSTFRDQFKRQFGMTPSEYRQNL